MFNTGITSYIKKWHDLFLLVLKADFSNDMYKLSKCDVLFFCHDVDRSVQLDGRAYSPLIDSVREDFEKRGLSCISIAHPWSLITKQKAFGSPLAMNRAYLKFFIKRLILKILGLKKDPKSNPYREILKKTGAKLVVTIGSPIDLAMAAREMGIFHVEILHGVGYSSLEWGWGELPTLQLPQGILSLDDVSFQSFSPLLERGIEVKKIPHPFLKLFINDSSIDMPSEWTYTIIDKDKKSKHILISLTWGYAGDHGVHTQFSHILENGLFYQEIAELIKEDQNTFWHFRFHPVQLLDPKYKFLIAFIDNFVSSNPNTEWLQSSKLPFPSVAKICDGCLLMSSMSCYDAAVMGVPSLMLCPTVQPGGVHEDFAEDLIAEGYLTKTQINKDVVRSWIHNTGRIKPRLNNLNDNLSWESAVYWMLERSGLNVNFY